MKKLKKKKKKTKKSWSKQCGYFFLKNVNYINGFFPTIDVFFKEELIGVIYTNPTKTTDVYTLDITGLYDEHNPFIDKRIIGKIECRGKVHYLPKSIRKIELISEKTILNLKRKVLIEKNKKIYITGSLYKQFPITGFLPPTDTNDIYKIR